MALSEFELIQTYFNRRPVQRPDVELGIGDDAAVVNVPTGHSLVMSLDTLVAGVHFPLETDPADIAYKSLAVNLSDLAAMGATPAWFLLGLTLPESNEAWLQAFSESLAALAQQYGIALIGGDTTRGPLAISVQVNGFVPRGHALKRSGAKPGDRVFVTGPLGDAGLGLKLLQRPDVLQLPPARRDYFINRLNRPTPRVEAGQVLREWASSAIDISDGLYADLGHILEASGVGANLHIENLPMADELQALGEDGWKLALTAGDDYELCFTAAAHHQPEIERRLDRLGCGCHHVGEITAGHESRLSDRGNPVTASVLKGYRHFG